MANIEAEFKAATGDVVKEVEATFKAATHEISAAVTELEKLVHPSNGTPETTETETSNE